MDPGGRKRPLPPGSADAPAAKKAALALDERQRERLRADVRGLYQRYEALVASPDTADEAAFQALLDAAQGGCAARRLAARLIPRFVDRFPNRADTAAALLTDLHEGRGAAASAGRGGGGGDPLSVATLEDAARRDALAGLGAVLRAVVGLPKAAADGVVARILEHLTRLLGELPDLDVASEPESEEGEVDDRAALVALARTAFTSHPHRLLAFCVGLLAKPERGGGRSSSGGAESSARRGARLLLNRLVLQPPPRGTDLAGSGGEAVSRQPSPAAGAQPGGPGCWLALVLQQDELLQQWVVQAAAEAGRGPFSEARQMLDKFVALLPPPPLPDSPPPPGSPAHGSGAARDAAVGGRAGALHPANGGSSQLPRNGLQRTGSGGGGSASRRELRAAFPPPLSAPVARVEPCLLVVGLPRHVTAAELAAEAGAVEAWLLDGPGGDEACLVFEDIHTAARCYSRCNGVPWAELQPLQQQHWQQRPPPGGTRLRLQFCGAIPAASARHGKAPPCPFVWVSGALPVSAQELVELLTAVNAADQVKSVVRVKSCDPGTLLQTQSDGSAQQVADLLLRRLAPQHAGGVGGSGSGGSYDPGGPRGQRWGGGSGPQGGTPLPRGGPPGWDRGGGGGGGPPPLPPPGEWGGPMGASPGSAARPPHSKHPQQQPPLPPPVGVGGPGPPRGGPADGTPPPLRRWPPLPPKWSGRLSKSSHVVAALVCVTPPGPLGGAMAEPYRWPEELAVLQRTRLRDVVDEYRSAPHELRAVRRLLPAAGPGSADDAQLGSFVEYLVSKERAGLVRLPRGDGVPHDRNLHLLVPDEGLLRDMGAAAVGGPRPGERALIAVITPARD